MKNNLLNYDFPAELETMKLTELNLLATLIRDFLIENISRTGGHLASNLGIVELSIAIHKIFNSPGDKIIWDVGHQCYVHKILTGRANEFNNLRQFGGISGFPKRSESPHDVFNSGHSSNSISAAMGFAEARDITGGVNSVISVIGDGALTGGQAFEGLNNAGSRSTKIIVILNDNEMSISRNIGGISHHLSHLRTSVKYVEIKKQIKKMLKNIPGIGKGLYSSIENIRDLIKYVTFQSGALFESLGFKYFGPVDGHNIGDLTEVLTVSKLIEQPVFIHVITKKGKGYRNAENNPDRFHGIGPFEPSLGKQIADESNMSSAECFGKKMVVMAEMDKRVTAITAAMADGTGLKPFAAAWPDRFFDTGIAEAHAVTFAAGLALAGFKPYVAVYSTFLQRAYDQILTDVCLQNLPVTFCVDRAGVTGADGETHQGLFDLSYFNHMPGMTVLAPASYTELERALEYSRTFESPLAIRYPRGWEKPAEKYDCVDRETGDIIYCESIRIRNGTDIDIWAVGSMVSEGEAICALLNEKGISAGLVNPLFIKPFDREEIINSARKYKHLMTLEDNVISGGFGESVSAMLMKEDSSAARLLVIAWPDKAIEHGDIRSLKKKYRMDAHSITEEVVRLLESKKRQT